MPVPFPFAALNGAGSLPSEWREEPGWQEGKPGAHQAGSGRNHLFLFVFIVVRAKSW